MLLRCELAASKHRHTLLYELQGNNYKSHCARPTVTNFMPKRPFPLFSHTSRYYFFIMRKNAHRRRGSW